MADPMTDALQFLYYPHGNQINASFVSHGSLASLSLTSNSDCALSERSFRPIHNALTFLHNVRVSNRPLVVVEDGALLFIGR